MLKLLLFISILSGTLHANESQVFILAQCHTLADNNSEELILNKVSPRRLVCTRNLSNMQCEMAEEDKKITHIFKVTEESKNHLLLKNGQNNHHIYINSETGKITSVQTIINTAKNDYLVGTEICRGITTSSDVLSKIKTSKN